MTITATRKLRLLAMVVLCAVALSAADYRNLSLVKTVYIMGMSNGFDQYLASRLTSSGLLWVVLDPVNADAVVTDRLDEDFWRWLNERYPNSARAPQPAGANDRRPDNIIGTLGPKVRGTLFLVDPKTRLVLWSVYDQVKKVSSDDLDQMATRVTKRLTDSYLNKK